MKKKYLRALEQCGFFGLGALLIRTKQPKLLPPDTFSGLKIYGNCVYGRGGPRWELSALLQTEAGRKGRKGEEGRK